MKLFRLISHQNVLISAHFLRIFFFFPVKMFLIYFSLKESDPVVKFTSNSKLMKVTYSPRLVTLISEVRQLTALGYRIPSKIEELSAHAKRFITYAKILEQVKEKFK